jgi:eukaryotic-like serine/threonine-protein kinase
MLGGRPPYAHSTLSAAASPPPPPSLSSEERPFSAEVDAVVRRGLAADREERYPDIPSFVAALGDALGGSGMGSLPARWLPIDPELTQPGNRPSLVPTPEELPAPAGPRRRRRWPAAVLALVLLVAGGAGGFTWWRGTHDTETFSDQRGTLSVTVPRSWARSVSLDGWIPPDATYNVAALSVGESRHWQSSREGQGVFVGLMPEGKLPTTLPQHPSCSSPGSAVPGHSGDPSVQSVSTGCPGVVIERAVRVSAQMLLWVQVRSDDRTTAESVLRSVRTRGVI